MVRMAFRTPTSSALKLTAIKVAHTIVWLFFVGCIFAIWAWAWRGDYFWAALAIAVVFVEIVVLALNGLHCPLTPIAARYTEDRRANFDIYLPEWLAARNKTIFGALFAGGVIFAFARWAFAAP